MPLPRRPLSVLLVLLANACASSTPAPANADRSVADSQRFDDARSQSVGDWQRFDYAPGISGLFPAIPHRVGDPNEEPPAVATDRIDDAGYLMMCFDTKGLTSPKLRAMFEEERSGMIDGRPLLYDKTADRDGRRESRFALHATVSSGVLLVQHHMLVLDGQTMCAFTVAVVDGVDRAQEVERFMGGIRIDVDPAAR